MPKTLSERALMARLQHSMKHEGLALRCCREDSRPPSTSGAVTTRSIQRSMQWCNHISALNLRQGIAHSSIHGSLSGEPPLIAGCHRATVWHRPRTLLTLPVPPSAPSPDSADPADSRPVCTVCRLRRLCRRAAC